MFAITPHATALVIIDLQEGIVALPLLPHQSAQVVAHSLELGQAFARVGGQIVLVNVAFSKDDADRPRQPVDAPSSALSASLPANWADVVAPIAALPARVHITKRQQSAFFGTELDLQLRRRGITTVVICGIATNFGIEATARDAFNFNYGVIIAEDACSSVAAGLHEFAITKILPRFARIRTTSEIIAALSVEANC